MYTENEICYELKKENMKIISKRQGWDDVVQCVSIVQKAIMLLVIHDGSNEFKRWYIEMT